MAHPSVGEGLLEAFVLSQLVVGFVVCLRKLNMVHKYIFDLVNTVHVHTDASLASCPHVFSFFCLGGGLGGLIVVFPFAFSWSTSNFSLSTVHIIIDLARSEGAKALLSITEPHGVKGIIRLDIRGHFDRRLGAVNLSLHLLGRAVVLVPELVLS